MKNSDMGKNCFNCGWGIDGGCDCSNEARCVDWDQWKPKLGRLIEVKPLEIIDNLREQFAFEFAKIILEEKIQNKGTGLQYHEISSSSVKLADELIKELDK